jgi:hypothetical protein
MAISKGLGDTIEKITTATGIKSVVEAVSKATGAGCGCSKRKDALNRAFPYDVTKQIKKIG